jgi:DNA-binding response OmpR family regulator
MLKQEQARVLIVDDEAPIRLTLEAILRRTGYSVTTAANGEEATDWLMQSSFDLLLIDLKLPGMDGLTFARTAQQSQPSAAILFITGSSDFKGVTVEEQVGHFDYILKTASPQEVMDRVASILRISE